MNLTQILLDYLFNDETKDKIVAALNENINIPIINEKTEAKILEAVYETVEAVMKDVLLK
tara:strand:- start:267 stop:446 length:180 start_codon:yes stop_codon:yes gene_type:complete